MIHSANKPSGIIIVSGEYGSVQADTLTCVHCGTMWQVVKGSGRHRGFCTCCMGPTCGRAECLSCTPMMKRIEEVEKGKRSSLF